MKRFGSIQDDFASIPPSIKIGLLGTGGQGKTLLINALIGYNILPHSPGSDHATAAPTEISYGSSYEVTVEWTSETELLQEIKNYQSFLRPKEEKEEKEPTKNKDLEFKVYSQILILIESTETSQSNERTIFKERALTSGNI